MAQKKRITLHPLLPDGTPDETVNLYPKTLITGIVDENQEEVAIQEQLVSGETIKTINGESLLGSGNIDVDASLSEDYYNKTQTNDLLDAKLDKEIGVGQFVYAHAGNTQTSYEVSQSAAVGGTIPMRTNTGQIYVNETPTENEHAVSKKYADGIRAVAEGKCKSFVINYQSTAPTTNEQAQALHKLNGEAFEDLSDFNAYVNSKSLGNSFLNSNDSSVILSKSNYYIFIDGLVLVGDEIFSAFKVGDNVYITNTPVPDRWVALISIDLEGVVLYSLETQSVDLTGYPTLVGSNTFTNTNTFSSGVLTNSVQAAANNDVKIKAYNGTDILSASDSSARWNVNVLPAYNGSQTLGMNSDSYRWSALYLKGNATLGSSTTANQGNILFLNPVVANQGNWYIRSLSQSQGITIGQEDQSGITIKRPYLEPNTNNYWSLGSSDSAWKNLYLSGSIINGNGSISYDAASTTFSVTGGYLFVPWGIKTGELLPYVTASYNLGSGSYSWNNLYLSGGSYFADNVSGHTLANYNWNIYQNQYNEFVFNRTYNGISQDKIALNGGSIYTKDANGNLGVSGNPWNDLYLSGYVHLKNANASNEWTIRESQYSELEYKLGTTYVAIMKNTYFAPYSTNTTMDLGTSGAAWKDLYLSGELKNTGSRTIDGLCGKTGTPTISNNEVTIPYDTISSLSLSASTTISLATAPTGCLPEYRAIITASAAITLTFVDVSVFLTNDEDNVVVTNGTNTTVALTNGTTVEISILNGHGIAVVF